MLGRDPGVDRDPLDKLGHLLVREIVDLGSGKRRAGAVGEAQILRDRDRRFFVVPGDHDGFDAGFPAQPDRPDGFGTQGILHREEAEEHQIPFHRIGPQIHMGAVETTMRRSQHAKRLVREGCVGV